MSTKLQKLKFLKVLNYIFLLLGSVFSGLFSGHLYTTYSTCTLIESIFIGMMIFSIFGSLYFAIDIFLIEKIDDEHQHLKHHNPSPEDYES